MSSDNPPFVNQLLGSEWLKHYVRTEMKVLPLTSALNRAYNKLKAEGRLPPNWDTISPNTNATVADVTAQLSSISLGKIKPEIVIVPHKADPKKTYAFAAANPSFSQQPLYSGAKHSLLTRPQLRKPTEVTRCWPTPQPRLSTGRPRDLFAESNRLIAQLDACCGITA